MSVESIRRELWMGEIPVCFSLDPDDLATIVDEPEPCCAMIPRNSYLPIHLTEVKSYFLQYVKAELQDSECWCSDSDSNGIKLKWHVPVGVMYDLLYGTEGQGQVWNVMLHFSDYPEQELLRCPSTDCVKSHFMSTVKEADSLKHLSRLMNDMKQSEHAMLWNGILNGSFDEFWTINRRLMDSKDTAIHDCSEYKNLPIRLYKPDRSYCQPLVTVPSDDNSDNNSITSLSDLLKSLDIELSSNLYILSQGVEIPLESSLYKLTHTLSYPDNFLYLCIVNRGSL